ncbi:MAG TPA: CAP domain-containing protein [Solirubrobacterales bacterium]|nr:CAP domain-containing protein [Solirubrobacterales bacterium]
MTSRGKTILLVALAAAVLAAMASSAAAGLVAPTSACPGQLNANARPGVQERAMRCLVNHAREQRGMAPLRAVPSLARAADRKSGDILRCDEFSHEACGREFTYWMERTGYIRGGCWQAAENIAWGTGRLGSPRAIFKAWIRSSGHRRNILGPFEDIGIGLQVGELEGTSGAHVWTQQFGTRGC